jgi:hypothetical protein
MFLVVLVLQEDLDGQFQDFKIPEPEFSLFALPVKVEIGKFPRNSSNGIN